MKNVTPLVALTLGLLVVAGCANKDNAAAQGPAVNGSVADVDVAPTPPLAPEMTDAAPPEVVPLPLPLPAGLAPVSEAPVVTETPAPSAAGAAETYTVKKGDTLFSIARQHYGNGGQWQRIANANPGLSPATLKAGATIAIP